jgi:ribonuclease Z
MGSDYPQGRGRVRVEAAGIEIEGVSIAGHESFYKVPALRALLEFGRAPEDTVGYSTIYLSHAHLDHAAGLAHHASRRKLGGLPPARVFAPKESASDLEAWVAACERLENVLYGVEILPAVVGESVRIRNDLEVRFLPGRHNVPAVAYLFSEVRQKLKEEFAQRTGPEIAALRARGTEITRREEIPVFAYSGDCGAEIFRTAPELLRARVLLIECSFLLEEDLPRARAYQHLHLQDFLENADRFENEAIVLTHFSLRYTADQIRAALQALPEPLAKRAILFLPSGESG